jgi:lipopolysaccharide export LptBFGC system permease protein LptF
MTNSQERLKSYFVRYALPLVVLILPLLASGVFLRAVRRVEGTSVRWPIWSLAFSIAVFLFAVWAALVRRNSQVLVAAFWLGAASLLWAFATVILGSIVP